MDWEIHALPQVSKVVVVRIGHPEFQIGRKTICENWVTRAVAVRYYRTSGVLVLDNEEIETLAGAFERPFPYEGVISAMKSKHFIPRPAKVQLKLAVAPRVRVVAPSRSKTPRTVAKERVFGTGTRASFSGPRRSNPRDFRGEKVKLPVLGETFLSPVEIETLQGKLSTAQFFGLALLLANPEATIGSEELKKAIDERSKYFSSASTLMSNLHLGLAEVGADLVVVSRRSGRRSVYSLRRKGTLPGIHLVETPEATGESPNAEQVA